MAANFDQRKWERFLGGPPVDVKKRFYPTTAQDVIDIVKEAEAASAPVKACGSHWAPCNAAVNANGFVVESNDDSSPRPSGKFNQTLHNVIGKNGCLTQAAIAFFRAHHPNPFSPTQTIERQRMANPVPGDVEMVDRGTEPFTLAHFEAGTKIYEMYSRLDAGDDTSDSLSALIPNMSGPWAPITLGGSGGQTLGGAISTGTHGGDVHLPPIADCVQAMHLVTANGKQHWIERALPGGIRLTKDDALKHALGPIDIHRDDDTFRAALVSVGRLGVVYSYVVRAVRPYALVQTTKKMTWEEAKTLIASNFPKDGDRNVIKFSDRFLQIIVNPQGRPAAEERSVHTCYVTTRTTTRLSDATNTDAARAQRSGVNTGKTPAFGTPVLGAWFCQNASDAALGRWLDPLVTFVAVPLYRTGRILAELAAGALLAAVAAALAPIPVGLPVFLAAGLSPTAVGAAVTTVTALSVGAEAIGFDDFTDKFSSIEIVLKAADVFGLFPETREKVQGALDVARIVKDVLVNRGSLTVGGLIAELCNKLVQADRLEYVRAVSEALIDGLGKPDDVTAISYAVMDGHDYADTGCNTRGVSLEAFIDAHEQIDAGDGQGPIRTMFRFVEGIFARLDQLQTGALPRAAGVKKSFGGYLALRFMSPTAGLIGMQRHRVTCSFELAGLGGCTGNEDMMREIEELATASGGTLHWGQSNDSVDAFAVERTYPDIEKWRDVLSAFSANGRSPTFSTPFTRKKGLEVYRPKVGLFLATPGHGAAGEEGGLFWLSTDNPPNTVAKLVIEEPGRPAVVRALPGLSGTDRFVVAPGTTKITYVVEHTVTVEGTSQTRPFKDQVVKTIRGFTADDALFNLEATASIREVDGLEHFAVFLQFGNGDWSANLRVERMTATFVDSSPPGFWEVQNSGTITRRFTSQSPTHSFSDRPFIGGDWLFAFKHHPFIRPQGPAPKLGLEFKFTADSLPLP